MSLGDATPGRAPLLPRSALTVLRDALLRTPDGRARLREAGRAAGEALHDAFAAEVRARTGRAPEALPLARFGEELGAFFERAGWGRVGLAAGAGDVVTIDADAWPESDVPAPDGRSACHLGTGLMGAFFGRVGGHALAAAEVECRAAGAARCRFVVGSPEAVAEAAT